nr:C2 domain-containing protein [Tanacetum cinerariifolium]
MIERLNPEWNEEFSLVVKDLNVQALEISVWEGKGFPVRMWKHDLSLEDVIPEQQKSLTFELLKDMDNNHVENNKSLGQLMIELMYKPLTRDEVRSYSEEANEVKKPLKVAGRLIVTIFEAEDIQVTNPFIYVTIENDRRQTTLAKKSFDPVWNEEFMFSFEKPPTNEILNLELHSSSQMSKLFQWTKRGHVNISLEDIVEKTRTKEMYHLEDTTRGGRIHVELEWRTSLQGRRGWRVLGHPKLAQLAHVADRIYVGERKTRKGQNQNKTGQKRKAWKSPDMTKPITVEKAEKRRKYKVQGTKDANPRS